jgi:hypothetical protein
MNNLHLATQAGFILVTIVYFALLFKQLKLALSRSSFEAARKRKIFNGSLIGLIGWTIFISVLSLIGFFTDFSSLPPKIAIVLVVPFVVIVWISTTRTVKELLMLIPEKNLVALQSFRIFVEILLWMLFLENVIPVQMTFEGRNFDVVVGLSSIIIYVLLNRKKISRIGLMIWNVVSLLILANIVIVALLSTPMPFRYFMNDPANTIIAYFPFVFLPGLLVPLAYGLHILSLKQVASLKPNREVSPVLK